MTEIEFKTRLKNENLFYSKKISINQGIIKTSEVFGCTKTSSENDTWYVFSTTNDYDRLGEHTIRIEREFSDEEKAFDYFYKEIKTYMRYYNRENQYIEKMSREDLIFRLKNEDLSVRGYYISFEEGIISSHKEKGEPKTAAKPVIGCSKPENGNCYQVFCSDKFSDGFYLYILKKFKAKESENAFAFFYNYLKEESLKSIYSPSMELTCISVR